jgi:hypothetical protein
MNLVLRCLLISESTLGSFSSRSWMCFSFSLNTHYLCKVIAHDEMWFMTKLFPNDDGGLPEDGVDDDDNYK